MNLHRKALYVPNLLAKSCLGLAIFMWLGDQVRSTRVHLGERCRLDVCLVVLSVVALGASSKLVSILGMIAFSLFMYCLIQEYAEVLYYLRLQKEFDAS